MDGALAGNDNVSLHKPNATYELAHRAVAHLVAKKTVGIREDNGLLWAVFLLTNGWEDGKEKDQKRKEKRHIDKSTVHKGYFREHHHS